MNRKILRHLRITQFALPSALAVFVGRLAIALALIPPWQQPDEPTHVAVIERFSARPSPAAGGQPGREAEIIQSMARHRWWEHRALDFRTPIEMPQTFGFRVGVPSESYTTPPAFALVYGWALGWLPQMSVVDDLYVLRAAAAGLGLLTLWVAWLAAREWVGPVDGGVVTLLLALHPQFAIVATSAGSDPMANFFGACVWWQATLALTRTSVRLPLAGMWASALAAAAADRMGVPLLALALLVTILAAAPRVRGRPVQRHRWGTLAAGVAVMALVAVAAWLMLSTFGGVYGFGWVFGRGLMPVPGVITSEGFLRFTWLLHQGWWYAIGWGRYTPPWWWMAIVTVLSATAIAGLGRRLWRESSPDRRLYTLVGVAVAAIALQTAAVYWAYFRLGLGGQGRYFFTLLVPSLLLFWVGIRAWAPPPRAAHAAAALILLFALLDATAWGLVAIPAYYASF